MKKCVLASLLGVSIVCRVGAAAQPWSEARDEAGMRALAPQYWEQKNAIHPVSVFVSAPNRYFIALQGDVRDDDQGGAMNPYRTAYWSYVGLVLRSSTPRPLPLWLELGLTEVMSNTIIRPSRIEVGRPIPCSRESRRPSRRNRRSGIRISSRRRSSSTSAGRSTSSPIEAASAQAGFLAAMGRPVQARALLAEMKVDARSPTAIAIEGLLMGGDGKTFGAQPLIDFFERSGRSE